jgi:hypothetical protein
MARANKKVQYKTFKGKPTDVLHSKTFNKLTLKKREQLAFMKNKNHLKKEDQLLLRGYAQACADKNRAYRYKHRISR